MAGYTPLFSSLTTGTLCGKWPDIGLWPIVLSLSDKHGVVDVTPQYLASVTGLALADVIACMARFCGPDPYSRTRDCSGARLELIDEHRDWGWRIVNHGKYAERARKQNHDQRRLDSGENAKRMSDRRETRRDPTGPDATREHPLSSSSSSSSSNKSRARKRGSRLADDFELTPDRKTYAVKQGANPEREFERFTNYWRAKAGSGATKLDWDATWRNWCMTAVERGAKPINGAPKPQVTHDQMVAQISRDHDSNARKMGLPDLRFPK